MWRRWVILSSETPQDDFQQSFCWQSLTEPSARHCHNIKIETDENHQPTACLLVKKRTQSKYLKGGNDDLPITLRPLQTFKWSLSLSCDGVWHWSIAGRWALQSRCVRRPQTDTAVSCWKRSAEAALLRGLELEDDSVVETHWPTNPPER